MSRLQAVLLAQALVGDIIIGENPDYIDRFWMKLLRIYYILEA